MRLRRRPAHAAPSRHARALGSPRRSPRPHNQVRPTYLTPRAGRRAGGRKESRPGSRGHSLAWEAASGPTWRSLGGPREGNRGSGPTRSQRVPAGADAEAPQLTTSLRGPRRRRRRLTASLRAVELGGRAGGARAQAVDRRNRPAEAAAATEGAGTGAGRTWAPLAGATAAAGARLPPNAAPPATVPQAFGEGRGRMGVSPHLGPFLVVVVVSGNFIKSVSLFLCLSLPEEPELPPRSGWEGGSKDSPAATGSD